jgi:hypothetical protein
MSLLSFFKKQFYVLIFCISLLSRIHAQDSITTGTPYTVIDGQYKTYFEKEGKLLAVKVESKRIFIQSFDLSTLKLIKRTHFDLSGNQVLERVTEINGRYFIFYSVFNKKENNVHLFCKEINVEAASVIEERFILKSKSLLYGIQSLTAEAVAAQPSEKDSGSMPVFNFDYSQDKSKVCVHYRYANESSNLIGIDILDQNLSVISSKEIKVPYAMTNILVLDYGLDKSGTLYMAWNVYDDTVPWFKRNNRSDSPYRTSILVFPGNSNTVMLSDVELPNKQISRLRFAENDTGYLGVAGFYHVGGTAVCIKGIFSSSINYSSGKLNRVVCQDIPDEVLNPYLDSASRAVSAKSYFEDLVLKKVIMQEDKSIVLIGEQVYDIEKTKSYPEEKLQIDLNHHYNDIFVVKMDSLGNMSWMKRLPKRQVGGKEKGGMSYRHLTFGNDHYFLFLDNAKNMSLPVGVRPLQHLNEQGGHLVYYKITDSNGDVRKKDLFDMRYINGYSLHQFASNRITKINEREFALEFYKRDNEDILVKVELK